MAPAASHWSGSCCAGEPQSSDWPMSAPHGDRTGGDPAWGSGRGGTLLARGVHDGVSIAEENGGDWKLCEHKMFHFGGKQAMIHS